MKKILSLLMILSFITSCSDDDSNGYIGKDDITIDDQQIKKIQLYDITDGEEHPIGVMDFKYDNDKRIYKARVEELDYNGGGVTSAKETMFTYNGPLVSFSTMREEAFSVKMSKGELAVDGLHRALRGSITEENDEKKVFIYKYDGRNYIVNTNLRSNKGLSSDMNIEWTNGNISLLEYICATPSDKTKQRQYERVEYHIYENNASLDLARLICFGAEGSGSTNLMYGIEEAAYLNCFARRMQNLPSRMTAFLGYAKEIKTFEYKRDRNNRVYEIKVTKERMLADSESETREYKYMINY